MDWNKCPVFYRHNELKEIKVGGGLSPTGGPTCSGLTRIDISTCEACTKEACPRNEIYMPHDTKVIHRKFIWPPHLTKQQSQLTRMSTTLQWAIAHATKLRPACPRHVSQTSTVIHQVGSEKQLWGSKTPCNLQTEVMLLKWENSVLKTGFIRTSFDLEGRKCLSRNK